jgi:signal transduction histidine kinase
VVLPKALIKSFDKRRLRNLLLLFFLALAVPTAVLIWQAYGQLKWEAFHQYRGVAEQLTSRIDDRLNEMINAADAHSFADYTFLVVSGDPSAKFVQRSPLSAYPVKEDLPGALGHFQVDTDGLFSTPLLPPEGTEAANLGIGESEYANRQQLAQKIQAVLADNRLVQSRQEAGVRQRIATSFAAPNAVLEEEKEESDKVTVGDEQYSQQVFDQLNRLPEDTQNLPAIAGALTYRDAAGEASQTEQRRSNIGKVSDLKLDADLQKKSEEAERDGYDEPRRDYGLTSSAGRSKRKEQIALPESAQLDDSEVIANVTGSTDLRISTFESEIDPFEFSILDSGHFVLFRKVWRDGERYIQGLLLDQERFTETVIGARFMDTTLADMSSLIVAYRDDVIRTISGRDNSRYPSVAVDLDGELLYRNRLTAPLDSLELIFSIERLPPGPGASVLGWVTLVLAAVFVAGFVILYRLGSGQIRLARQQQDFVSAVSHELKSPLTSIRMYGEMLKEGWADEEKRQSYYEFIHDESERLSRLIANVLQLASITRNEPQFDLKPMNVGELMSNPESKISSQIERSGFELKFEIADGVDQSTINVDEDCFTQIIINLVDNAVKFSKDAESKVIEISSILTGDKRVLFSVRDYGPGIPKDQMKKIFELFYRSESELTRETVGTGIGLAIVHQLTLAMNGSVDMINAEPGAEFRIWFPGAETEK